MHSVNENHRTRVSIRKFCMAGVVAGSWECREFLYFFAEGPPESPVLIPAMDPIGYIIGYIPTYIPRTALYHETFHGLINGWAVARSSIC